MFNSIYNFFSYSHSLPRVIALTLRGAQIGRRVRLYNNYLSLPWKNACGLTLGDDVQICKWSMITIKDEGKISIRRGTSIGKFNQIFCSNEILIDSGCLFSDHVKITDSSHILDSGRSPVFSGFRKEGSVFIGKNCFIGQGAVIEPGVVIGYSCVVGAYAVLTKNSYFPPNSVIVGQPAKVTKYKK